MASDPITPTASATGLSRSDQGVIFPLWLTSFHKGFRLEACLEALPKFRYDAVRELFAAKRNNRRRAAIISFGGAEVFK